MHKYDLVIIGLGPAGIAAALKASEIENYNILCIEKGLALNKRNKGNICGIQCSCKRKPYCDVLSGFGGASLVSGTKLSGYPAGSGLIDIIGNKKIVKNKLDLVLGYFDKKLEIQKKKNISSAEEAEEYYAKLGYENKYYISHSFDDQKYKTLLESYYKLLLKKNVNIKFKTMFLDAVEEDKEIKIAINDNGQNKKIISKKLIIATGKSGYTSLFHLANKLNFEYNSSYLEIGIRLEFPSILFNDIDKIQADLKLKSGLCRTYCVSKYGEVVTYNYENKYFTEGRVATNNKTVKTNLAIVLRLPPAVDNLEQYLSIMDMYDKIYNGKVVTCSYADFIEDKRHISKVIGMGIFHELKKEVLKFTKTFFQDKDLSLIKISLFEQDFPMASYKLKDNFEIQKNIFIVGAATGRFRGIIQSFMSGEYCVEKIIKSRNNNE